MNFFLSGRYLSTAPFPLLEARPYFLKTMQIAFKRYLCCLYIINITTVLNLKRLYCTCTERKKEMANGLFLQL